ncbi:MAG: SRPBCC family protein [Chitinophagales bacterium]|nr:SRPBCC family protein [Chitinophagales bacterium]MDW8427995.1 SRPBCC family protein [Chitinophagales bacterium]
MHQLIRKQLLPLHITEAWEFFSSPLNLQRITPPDMRFKILTSFGPNDRIYPGLIIDYTVSPLWHIPLHWQTLISDVQEPILFVDFQQRGPFRYWRHEHHFEEHTGKTLMTDIVHWSLYGGWFGLWINKYIVEPRIKQIFNYRSERLKQLFGPADQTDLPQTGPM